MKLLKILSKFLLSTSALLYLLTLVAFIYFYDDLLLRGKSEDTLITGISLMSICCIVSICALFTKKNGLVTFFMFDMAILLIALFFIAFTSAAYDFCVAFLYLFAATALWIFLRFKS